MAAYTTESATHQILSAKTPTSHSDIRYESRKYIAGAIRGLLKGLGIKGISVTAPVYSMAQAIDIRVPDTCEHDSMEARRACPVCQNRNLAVRRIEELILAAYPDLDDRSDSMSDHYDYKLSIR